MRQILINGADLEGIPRVPALEGTEKVIWVTHGPVLQADSEKLQGRQEAVHAALIVQSDQSVSTKALHNFREIMSRLKNCRRVFGLTRGWKVLPGDSARRNEIRRNIFDFLASDKSEPDEPELQRLLGTDLPVRRMALQFALQVAREQIGKIDDIKQLLAPAAVLIEVEPLQTEFTKLGSALTTEGSQPTNEWQGLIDDAINRLQLAAN
jgi:hypothetical protein